MTLKRCTFISVFANGFDPERYGLVAALPAQGSQFGGYQKKDYQFVCGRRKTRHTQDQLGLIPDCEVQTQLRNPSRLTQSHTLPLRQTGLRQRPLSMALRRYGPSMVSEPLPINFEACSAGWDFFPRSAIRPR